MKTVYIVGAGFNQCVEDWDGVKPPMSMNFFRILFQSRKLSRQDHIEDIREVFDYIKEYWKLTIEDLKTEDFDLEELFTLLQLHIHEVQSTGDNERHLHLVTIYVKLTGVFAELLKEFEMPAHMSEVLREFGKRIYSEQPNILSFNYDCILESAIESASGMPSAPEAVLNNHGSEEIHDDELPYSHFNWNRPLAYGFTFDEVKLHRAGVSVYVDGDRFYGHAMNNLYDWRILKLHGSLSWFRYTRPIHPAIEPLLPEVDPNAIIVGDGHWHFNTPPIKNGWIIEPVIITPVLYKDGFYGNTPFPEIWNMAKDVLSGCDRLVIIGYSFPKTDFNVRKLLLESFAGRSLKELVVINPNSADREKTIGIVRGAGKVEEFEYLENYLGLS